MLLPDIFLSRHLLTHVENEEGIHLNWLAAQMYSRMKSKGCPVLSLSLRGAQKSGNGWQLQHDWWKEFMDHAPKQGDIYD